MLYATPSTTWPYPVSHLHLLQDNRVEVGVVPRPFEGDQRGVDSLSCLDLRLEGNHLVAQRRTYS